MPSEKKAGTGQQYEKHPFQLSIEELSKHLGDIHVETGLSPAQVQELRSKYGENKLEGQGGVKWYAVLFKQISNAMILVSILPFHIFPTPL